MRNIFWSYGEDGASIAAATAVLGTLANALLGGWDSALRALCAFMLFDFVLGFLSAAKHRQIDSRVMLWGGINKLLVLGLVGVGVVLDGIVALEEPYIRAAVIWFYIGREGLSLIENYGKMGLPLPQALVQLLEQLKPKA